MLEFDVEERVIPRAHERFNHSAEKVRMQKRSLQLGHHAFQRIPKMFFIWKKLVYGDIYYNRLCALYIQVAFAPRILSTHT